MSRRRPVTGARERSFALVTSVALALASAACGRPPTPRPLGTSAEGVVYGESSSREWVDRERAPAELTRTVALIPLAMQGEDEDRPTLGEVHPELCPEAAWLDQPSLSVCTGILLGDDWAVTARHCFDELACEDYAIVRNYALDARGRLPPPSPGDAFRCRRVLGDVGSDGSDLAVFELDRITEVEPARLVERSSLGSGVPVFVAGYPLGTPLKVDEDAWLLSAEPLRIWGDAFAGSSGGPVMDETGALLGLLTRGARDFQLDPRGCFAVRELEEVDEAGGEHVEPLLEALCNACRTEPDAAACESISAVGCRSDIPARSAQVADAGCMLARGSRRDGTSGLSMLALIALCRRRAVRP